MKLEWKERLVGRTSFKFRLKKYGYNCIEIPAESNIN